MSDQGTVHSPKPRFAKLPVKLMHDKNITDGAKVLYAHMRWRFGSNGKNFEGRASMAEFLGVTTTTISNRIRELEAAGWIAVVERYKPKTGNYLTPFYHVFERLIDCQNYRAAYKAIDGEELRPKPDIEVRKSRKGKGGNPKLKAKTTQVDRDNHDNLSLHGADNSSSHNLDAVSYLDSLKDTSAANADDVPTTDEKPMTFDDFPEMDWSTVKNRQQQMKEVVHQVWGFPVGSTRNTMFEMMLRGKSDNKTVKDGNIPPEYGKRFEPYELGDWHDWYMANGIKSVDKVMPTSAPIIQASIMEWIDAGKPKGKVQSKPANNRPVVTAPADNSPADDRAAIADLLAAGRRALETDGVQ